MMTEKCQNCGVQHRTRTFEECVDRDMSERTLQDRIRDRAKRRGWKVMHVAKAIAAYNALGEPIFLTPADPGWPDLTLAKAGHRLVFFELKKETGVVTEDQLTWLDLLNKTGNFAVVIRPSDLRLRRVNAILLGQAGSLL